MLEHPRMAEYKILDISLVSCENLLPADNQQEIIFLSHEHMSKSLYQRSNRTLRELLLDFGEIKDAGKALQVFELLVAQRKLTDERAWRKISDIRMRIGALVMHIEALAGLNKYFDLLDAVDKK